MKINEGLITCIKGLYPEDAPISDSEAHEAALNLIGFFETLIVMKKKQKRKELENDKG